MVVYCAASCVQCQPAVRAAADAGRIFVIARNAASRRHGDLGAALFAKVSELLQASGVKLSGGMIVDATLIETPSPTRN
jgi:hypothetical protein